MMSDDTNIAETVETPVTSPAELDGLAPLIGWPEPELVRDAVANAAAAAEPITVGDFGLLIRTPPGYGVHHVNVRAYEDRPREIVGVRRFVGVEGFAGYVNRYREMSSAAYAIDIADPVVLLRQSMPAVVVVIDECWASGYATNRQHRAVLMLVPTPSARRWGEVLERWIDQETLLDLVVDGCKEIAEPDAAVLRDLASNLHAIRQVDVESVIRTGGEGTITVSENVKLRRGTGSQVTFPEEISVMLRPFKAASLPIAFKVRVKAAVRERHVQFFLSAPDLGDILAGIVEMRSADVTDATGLQPMWRADTDV